MSAARCNPLRRFAVLLLASATLIPAYGDRILNVEQCDQEMNQWCWAATCQAALKFYGLSATQTDIAAYGTGGANVWNYLWGSGNPGDGIFRHGCDQILSNFGSVSGTGYTGKPTLVSVKSDIDGLRPVIINWAWDGGGGHILLTHGYVGNSLCLMDPWYGPSVSDYDWVCSGSGHTWQWTLALHTASAATQGTPRWWLGEHGLTNNWNADALADRDGDGMAAWEEYAADTDPTNTASCFNLSVILDAGSPTAVAVEWTASSNRFYTVQTNRSPTSQSGWANVPGFEGVRGSGGQDSCAYTSGVAPALFFRGSVSP